MVGRDVNSDPLQFRTWVVNTTPDFDGYYYAGLKSGEEPFIDVSAYTILDGYAVVDFNYPDATQWITTNKVLPDSRYNAQLAILDGYAYLFGGEYDGYNIDGYGVSAKIFKADLNNPADWSDTYAELPVPLAASQFAIVDGYAYLFGGIDGYTGVQTKHVFSASLSNILSWTDRGEKLPKGLSDSQLSIKDGYLYLYGGHDLNSATDIIFRATTGDPLTWTQMSNVLPQAIYGSHIGIIDGYTYLFGGVSSAGAPVNNIFKSSFVDPTSLTSVGTLPFGTYFGQFFTIGRDGYLIAPSDTSASYTKVFRCNLDTPTVWTNTGGTVPGTVSQSQVAIIYDRVFLFGGNGSSIIFTSNQFMKYSLVAQKTIDYGSITRTQYDATVDPLNLFKLLGFPYWKTNYGS